MNGRLLISISAVGNEYDSGMSGRPSRAVIE
jgi:hypothetical protein